MTKLLLALAAPCLAAVSWVAADDDLELAMAVLEKLDHTPLRVDYLDEPLAVVVDEIADMAGVPVRADWDALHTLGIRPRDLVKLRVDRASATTVIAGLVSSLGDAFSRPVWEVHAGHVVITSQEATAAMRLTDVYDVRDLLRDGSALTRLRMATAPAPAPPPDEAGGSRPDDAGTAVGDPDDPAEAGSDEPEPGGPDRRGWTPGPSEAFLRLIVEHVDPEAWIEFGGARGRISERGGLFLVTVAPTTHRRLRETLERLREASPAGLHLEVGVVELAEAELRKLERVHAPGSRALARAVLRHDDARLLWRTSAGVSIGRAWDGESRAEGIEIVLHLEPRVAEASGQVAVAVELRTDHAGETRRVVTDVPLPPRHGGAVIEVPAPTPTALRRLLVLLP